MCISTTVHRETCWRLNNSGTILRHEQNNNMVVKVWTERIAMIDGKSAMAVGLLIIILEQDIFSIVVDIAKIIGGWDLVY